MISFSLNVVTKYDNQNFTILNQGKAIAYHQLSTNNFFYQLTTTNYQLNSLSRLTTFAE